ncbi:SusC/RagA family TonB-linked outer membrane protein, partial [Bacteroides ovatus]
MQKLNSGALNRILLFVYILSLSTNAIAQNKNNSKETYLLPPHGNYVYGRVIEKLAEEPMVGVTIRLDGHSTGVITDINGCYVLTLPEKGGLVIYSYIGFETRKIKVTSRQKVDVQMVEATESIQEVIVTGY